MRPAIRLVLIVLCLSSSAFAAPFDDLIKRHRFIGLGDAYTASNFAVAVGHINIVLESGTVSRVMAGDEQVGLFLSGTGTFTYESVNKDEVTALRYNSKHADQTLQGSTIKEKFKSALIRGTGLPTPSGATAGAPAAVFNENRERFAQQQFTSPVEHLLILQKLNAPESRVVVAEIDATSRPYVYTYDDAWTRDESLVLLRRPTVRNHRAGNWLFPTVLSSQAIGRSNRAAAPANAVLSHLDVLLINTEKDDAKLTVEETLVPQRRVGALVFELYKDYIYDIDREPKHFNVRSVTDEAGNKLAFDHKQYSLIVGLAQPAAAGKPVKLRFEIDGNFLYRPDGSQYWELGIEPWFPSVNRFENAFTYHSLIKVRKPFQVFTSGKTIRREQEGDWNVLETKLDQPVSMVAILAGRYNFDEETRNGVTVRVASFVSKNTQAFKTLRNLAFAAIESYPTFLGPFPFDEINVLEKNAYGYGQAPAGIVFITKEAFTPKLGDANLFVEGINRRFAHEIAHQYWGHAVKIRNEQDQWIEEAFSEYSAALFMKMIGKPGDYDKAFIEWKTDANMASPVATIPMANRLNDPGDRLTQMRTRQSLIYSKGAYMLAALHRELGDQLFLTFLKSYQKSFRWKHGTTEDVAGLLQVITKKDYKPWLEQYFYGTELPAIAKK